MMFRLNLLLVLLLKVAATHSSLPLPVAPLLQMAWDQFNSEIVNNQVKVITIEKVMTIEKVKSKLHKLEHAVVFARDLRTLEHLIEKYNMILLSGKKNSTRNQNSNERTNTDTDNQMVKWADTALEFGSDGLERPLKSIEDIMEGSNHLFADTSIFNVIVKEGGDVCSNIAEASDYLLSLWSVGHALWAQAYKIKNQDFEQKARDLQTVAKTKAREFVATRDAETPGFCNCFERGIYYTTVNHLTNPEIVQFSSGILSPNECQANCKDDQNCAVWTFDRKGGKCFMFGGGEHSNEVLERGKEDDIISGPAMCVRGYSFCCGLGYGVSVFIALIITLLVLALFCCPLCICCR